MNQKEFQPYPIDLEIFGLTHNNARISNEAIAESLNIVPSEIPEQLKKLEQKNINLQYTTHINHTSLQQNPLADVSVKTSVQLEVHHANSEDYYLFKTCTFNSASLMDLMGNRIGNFQIFFQPEQL